MKHSIPFCLAFLVILTAGCSMQKKANEDIRHIDPVFPKGEILSSDNFTGTVWLYLMGAEDSTLYAISLNIDKGGAVWIGPVTDEEYEDL